MNEPSPRSGRWPAYYDAISGRPPNKTLLEAARRFDLEGEVQRSAVDLGCGSGRDTLELLRRGWRVRAIDADEDGVRRLGESAGANPDLVTQLSRVEDVSWEPVDLVNASVSIFFMDPAAFSPTWLRIVGSLKAGGRFSGQLLGDRDTWAADPTMTHHTRGEAESLLRGLDVELFQEDENPSGRTATGTAKHWHLFHIVARKSR